MTSKEGKHTDMNRLPFWLQVLKGRMPQSPFLVLLKGAEAR